MTEIRNIEDLRRFKPQIEALAAEYGVRNIRVFGSVARGEATEESDVDLLVELSRPLGFDYMDLLLKMEDLLEKPVQINTETSLSKYVKPYIQEDIQRL